MLTGSVNIIPQKSNWSRHSVRHSVHLVCRDVCVRYVCTAGLQWDDHVAATELAGWRSAESMVEKRKIRVKQFRDMGDKELKKQDNQFRRTRMEELFGKEWDLPRERGGVFARRLPLSDDEGAFVNDRDAPALRKAALKKYVNKYGPAPLIPPQEPGGATAGGSAAGSAHAHAPAAYHVPGTGTGLGIDDDAYSDIDADLQADNARGRARAKDSSEDAAAAAATKAAAAAAAAAADPALIRKCTACGNQFIFTNQRQCVGGMCPQCNGARIKLSRLIGPEASDKTLRTQYGAGSERPRAYGATMRKQIALRFAKEPNFYNSPGWVENSRHPKKQLAALFGQSVEDFLESCPYR